MSELLDNEKTPSSNFRKVLQERVDRTNQRCTLADEEQRRSSKLEAVADKSKCPENVQNHQLQTWLSEHEYAQIEVF